MDTLSIIAVFGTGILFYIVGLLMEVFAKTTDSPVGNDMFLPILQVVGMLITAFAGMFFIADGQTVLGGFVGTLGGGMMVVSGMKLITFLRY